MVSVMQSDTSSVPLRDGDHPVTLSKVLAQGGTHLATDHVMVAVASMNNSRVRVDHMGRWNQLTAGTPRIRPGSPRVGEAFR